MTAIAAAAVLSLSACGPDEDAEFEDEDNAEQTSENEETSGSADEADSEHDELPDEEASDGEDDSDEGSDAAAPGESSGLVDPEDAAQTVTYSIPNPDIDGDITVGFHHLRARDETMELLLTVTPEFGEHEAYNLFTLHDGRFAARLSDRQNLKQYTILGAQHGSPGWATPGTPGEVEIHDGETLAYWANYPIPEDDIDVVSISVHENAPELEDVDIDWGEAEPSDLGGDGSDPEADEEGDIEIEDEA
ncbi:hypothetical protein [Nesterenkonia pannonica]|uniref:hypothetical protein n=1 Tax=Nesterenkonia pannonica TaxID=1548602 RepID=UPI0021640834|nr:hypothetical protein [Nesterenkonia pannonica]